MDYYNIDNIDKFLKQQLSTEAMTSFQKAMDKDSLLKDAVDGYRFMKEDGVDLDDMLQNSKRKMKHKPLGKTRMLHSWKSIAIAASIVILLGVAGLIQLTSGPNINDYDFKDAGLPVHLGALKVVDYTVFTNFYKLGDYKNALQEIDVLIQKQSNNDTLLYYKACIHKEHNSYIKAIEYFKMIKPSSAYFEKANYQEAMCYWYIDDKENLLNTLNTISKSSNHLFYHQSLLILKKL